MRCWNAIGAAVRLKNGPGAWIRLRCGLAAAARADDNSFRLISPNRRPARPRSPSSDPWPEASPRNFNRTRIRIYGDDADDVDGRPLMTLWDEFRYGQA